MTEANWLNTSDHPLADRARGLHLLRKQLPNDRLVKQMFKETIQNIRNKKLVEQAKIDAGWLELIQ